MEGFTCSCSQSSTANTSNTTRRRQKQAIPPELGTKQGTRSCSTHSYMKRLSGSCNRDNHSVRLVEDDPDTDLSNPRFADDILLVSGSNMRPPCWTTPPQPQRHTAVNDSPRKQNHLQRDIPKNRRNSVTVQGMNIEVPPREGKIKYLGQLITFKDPVQVEFDHRINCAWATFTSHRQELTSPKYPPRKTDSSSSTPR